MSLAEALNKSEIISSSRLHDKDTGSPEVQVALITKRLEVMSAHFKTNPNDIHSQRGMFRLISRRKRLLAYLKEEGIERYRNVLAAQGLRK